MNDNIVCLNCGHSAEHHLDLFGVSMGCDIELTYGDGLGLCGCDDFVPVVLPERVEVN